MPFPDGLNNGPRALLVPSIMGFFFSVVSSSVAGSPSSIGSSCVGADVSGTDSETTSATGSGDVIIVSSA
ncbi:hypothetical protein GC174_17080 [bacterium]|nr:hypothetical protein [bacterium]